MILALSLPAILPEMTEACVTGILSTPGALRPGAPLLDLSVDLSAVALQDCPPISYYRLALREAAWLRRVMVAVSDRPAVGATLLLFSTEADEDLSQAPARQIRHMVAGIVGGTDLLGW